MTAPGAVEFVPLSATVTSRVTSSWESLFLIPCAELEGLREEKEQTAVTANSYHILYICIGSISITDMLQKEINLAHKSSESHRAFHLHLSELEFMSFSELHTGSCHIQRKLKKKHISPTQKTQSSKSKMSARSISCQYKLCFF